MKLVIDTCSLLSLVRYYMVPFDGKGKIYELIEGMVEEKEIIVLDKVVDECKYTSKGIIMEKLDFLANKKNQFKTDDLLPDKKFFNMLEHQFVNATARAKALSKQEFEAMKDDYLKSADAKLLLYCLREKKLGNSVTLITEESDTNNDSKLFKKIPAICKLLDVDVTTLPEFIPQYVGFDIRVH